MQRHYAGMVVAQPAHAADRFAREIIGFLTVFVMRSRRLMGNSLGGVHHAILIPLCVLLCLQVLRSERTRNDDNACYDLYRRNDP